MKIKELYLEARPREKAFQYGIESLSNRELLAILIRSGTKNKSALDIAEEVLNEIGDIHRLFSIDLNKLEKIKGISKLKVLELSCICELSKRIALSKVKTKTIISDAKILGDWLNQYIGHLEQEHFVVVFLDVKNQIIAHKTIFIGSLSASIVHPREVFKEAMRSSAHSIIIAHNHPSGDIDYSQADLEITKKLINVGKMCGINVIDHVIVGKNRVFSFREHGVVIF